MFLTSQLVAYNVTQMLSLFICIAYLEENPIKQVWFPANICLFHLILRNKNNKTIKVINTYIRVRYPDDIVVVAVCPIGGRWRRSWRVKIYAVNMLSKGILYFSDYLVSNTLYLNINLHFTENNRIFTHLYYWHVLCEGTCHVRKRGVCDWRN